MPKISLIYFEFWRLGEGYGGLDREIGSGVSVKRSKIDMEREKQKLIGYMMIGKYVGKGEIGKGE